MKPILFVCLAIVLLSSCGSNNSDAPVTEIDSLPDIYMWKADLNDSSGLLQMKKELSGIDDSLSIPVLFTYLNKSDSLIKIDYVKTGSDTIYAKIDDATVLTQQRGTTGALQYMARVVYDLTELPGIHFVALQFEEGDHAAPGVYSRDSFKDQ